MIEITQAGQAGKTSLLFDMHRLRTRVFKENLCWDVQVTEDGLEVDQFDLPDAAYLLALNDDKRVIGTWRLLPTSGPTMIRDLWPQFLESLPMPQKDTVWEVSRFAINPVATDPQMAQEEAMRAVGEMFCGLTELCISCGITDIFTFYDDRIARVIRRIDCAPYATSKVEEMYGTQVRVGAFKTDAAMLQRLRAATGITSSMIDGIELPMLLAKRQVKARQYA